SDGTAAGGASRTRGSVGIVSRAESADGADWPNPQFGPNSPANPAKISRPRGAWTMRNILRVAVFSNYRPRSESRASKCGTKGASGKLSLGHLSRQPIHPGAAAAVRLLIHAAGDCVPFFLPPPQGRREEGDSITAPWIRHRMLATP